MSSRAIHSAGHNPGGGILIAAATAVLGLLGTTVVQAGDRPLSDFLDAQGTISGILSPMPDYLVWLNHGELVSSSGKSMQWRCAQVDYAGISAKYLKDHVGLDLGTEVSGFISERPLKDGRAEVLVVIHTTNALAWAQDCTYDFGFVLPSAFGEYQTDLLSNPSLVPGLASGHMVIKFKNTALGAPYPDLLCTAGVGECTEGFELLSLYFHANGAGPLHASSGFADGTPGKLVVTETGIFRPGPYVSGNSRVAFDGWPAERVDWHR
jgi:hypothetical protein